MVNIHSNTFSKYVVYVDESGDHSLQKIDEKYPLFVLAFCVFHKQYYSEEVVSALEKFKFKHFGHDQIVLHERDIRKETAPFDYFDSRAVKQAFIQELTTLIDESNFILISCVVDKRFLSHENNEERNPYNLALRFCLEKLYVFLEEKEEHLSRTHVVVECRGKKEDTDLELDFSRICEGQNALNRPFPMDIIFADKKAMSSGLQLADLVARPIGLKRLRPEQDNRAFEVLKKKFLCKGGRRKVGVDYEGEGLCIYPHLKS